MGACVARILGLFAEVEDVIFLFLDATYSRREGFERGWTYYSLCTCFDASVVT